MVGDLFAVVGLELVAVGGERVDARRQHPDQGAGPDHQRRQHTAHRQEHRSHVQGTGDPAQRPEQGTAGVPEPGPGEARFLNLHAPGCGFESQRGPVVVDVDAFALQNAFEVNYGLEAGKVLVLLNAGASAININILQGDQSVFTRDIGRALNASRKLEFGTVWINDHIPLVSEMPHGGFKQSGYGKDLSSYSLEDYTQVKHVMAKLD